MRLRWSVLLALGSMACGSPMKAQRLSDGTWKVTCKSSLEECSRRAPEVCGEADHRIVGGGSENKLYGTPGNQVSVGRSEVIVACDAAPGSPGAPPPAESTRVCTPGSTLRCFGPGACSGGQACLPDGSGFGPCDCGPAAPPAPLDAGAG